MNQPHRICTFFRLQSTMFFFCYRFFFCSNLLLSTFSTLLCNYRKNVNIALQAVHWFRTQWTWSTDDNFSTITNPIKQTVFRVVPRIFSPCTAQNIFQSKFQHLHGISCNAFWFCDLSNQREIIYAHNNNIRFLLTICRFSYTIYCN